MTFPGMYNFSAGAVGPGRGGFTPGRMRGGMQHGLGYPNPFFDIAHTYLPATVKELFKYCRYYFMTNSLINATVFKLSEYPITDIIIDHENDKTKSRWEEYFHDHLQYRPFQVECGLDYNTYGNCLVSVVFPFQKYLKCRNCGYNERADKIRPFWKFTNFGFRMTCPSCGSTGDAIAKDFYYKNASGIRLLRWNVEDVEVQYNDITGECTYFYTIPQPLRSDIVIGKKDVVEQTPQIFIQALRQQKGIIFSKDNLFHLKRPTLAWQDRGWGIPLILPVLKDTFYLQIMKKAQEAVLLEHVVPLRVLFPQAASGTSDPFTTINLVQWKEQVATEIARWRYDNNYIPIMPLPMGNQSIGGDGKALLLMQEMQMWSEHIIMGMGVPREFLMGGMSYAGTNVSMRMLENAFIGYILRHKLMANWVMKMVANYMEWPMAKIRFKPFKMADDIQRKAYLFQLNQSQKISDTTLLADADLNMSEEDDIMVNETDKRLMSTKKQQLAMADIQGEAQTIMMKHQAKAQQTMAEAQMAGQAPGEPGGPEEAMAAMQGGPPPGGAMPIGGPPQAAGGPAPGPAGGMPAEAGSQLGQGQDLGAQPGQEQVGMDPLQLAYGYAQQLMQLPPDQQQLALQAIQAQSPELAQLVQEAMRTMGQQGGGPPAGGPQVDMRPLPDKLPPRREAAIV